MHKNHIWLSFLLTILIAVLWFTVSTFFDLYLYYSMDAKASPLSIEWSVEGKSSDRYFLLAKYAFQANSAPYEGKTRFEYPAFKTVLAGERAIQEEKKKSWNVSYSPKNPAISTLQNLFPFKSCIYAGILWALLLYFVWLGFYVGKFRNQTHVKDLGHGANHP